MGKFQNKRNGSYSNTIPTNIIILQVTILPMTVSALWRSGIEKISTLLNFGVWKDSWEYCEKNNEKNNNRRILELISLKISLEPQRTRLKVSYLGCIMRSHSTLEKALMLGKLERKRLINDQQYCWRTWNTK